MFPEPETRPSLDLKQQISRACGPTVQLVKVDVKSASVIEVQLSAASASDATRAAQSILRIPELNRFRVDVSVQLAPHGSR
ncbi:MAG: hypothetical protein FJ271_31890 [Planctomycetes bacterium]|nr:hypothetical protein [Planctomycetota bacterium]